MPGGRAAMPRLLGPLLGRLGGGSLARRVAILAGGTAIGQGLIVLSSPVLTRLYTPEDFGLLAVYVSMMAPLVVIGSWRYQLAIPLPRDERQAANLLALSFIALVVMAGALAALTYVAGPPLLDLLDAPQLEKYLWLLPVSFAGACAYQALYSWSLRQREYRHLARTRVAQSAGQVGAQVALGVAGVAPFGLLLGDAIGRTSGAFSLGRSAVSKSGETLRSVSLRSVVEVAGRYRRFPIYAGGSGLLSSASYQAPTLLLASHYGIEITGLYALANRLQAVTITLVSAAIGDVFLAEAASLLKDDPERIRALFWRILNRSLLIGLLLTVAISVPAPFLFGTVFGDQWSEAGKYIQILAPMFALSFASRAVSSTLDVLERQELDLLVEAIWLGGTVGAFLVGYALDLDAPGTLALFSGTGCVCAIAAIFLAWVSVRHPFLPPGALADTGSDPPNLDLVTRQVTPAPPAQAPATPRPPDLALVEELVSATPPEPVVSAALVQAPAATVEPRPRVEVSPAQQATEPDAAPPAPAPEPEPAAPAAPSARAVEDEVAEGLATFGGAFFGARWE
jgi:O-antigen/teichoic acid export membrane protein